ncbi:resolvase [Vibrio owensii]|uniref:recombinase family protein n=1 Tax=Vibrio owensii TaxID=696485 RepID=UPI00104D5444|nr:recombinase family protein [Vibrio owensii]NOI73126.1 helix-turn-helix domain-containing protein [Vibrio owensii]TDE24662.1 resolvase [Vibrio owensii]
MADLAYIRVSSTDQNVDRQLDGLTFDKTYIDKITGSTTDRPALLELKEYARSGDVIHVHSIDRLARSLIDLKTLVSDWNKKGISVKFYKENMVFSAGKTNDPMTELMFNMLASFAEFERSMIRSRQAEGIAKAKLAGVYKGRKANKERNSRIEVLLSEGMSIRKIANEVGCNPSTVQRVKRSIVPI